MKKKKLISDSKRYYRHKVLKQAGYVVNTREKTVSVYSFLPAPPKVEKFLRELQAIGYNIQLTII